MAFTKESKLLFEEPWFHKLFSACKDEGLDWIRMCATALVLSNGDPRAREIDWEFLYEKIGPDNPNFACRYDTFDRPGADVIDRATRWGLFKIHGQLAVEMGFKGRLVNFIDIGVNIRMACRIMAGLLNEHDLPIAEKKFGVSPKKVDLKVLDLQASIGELLSISKEFDAEVVND